MLLIIVVLSDKKQIVSEAVAKFGRIGEHNKFLCDELYCNVCPDVLVSNAGICPFWDFLSMPLEVWERTRQVNLDGSFYIVQGSFDTWALLLYFHVSLPAVANQMKSQQPQGGAIIAVSSISAFVGGEFQWSVFIYKLPEQIQTDTVSHYTPTKAGILSLMRSCAVALGKYNIRCNSILPGTIATDINKDDLSDLKKREYMEQRTVLGRLGSQ